MVLLCRLLWAQVRIYKYIKGGHAENKCMFYNTPKAIAQFIDMLYVCSPSVLNIHVVNTFYMNSIGRMKRDFLLQVFFPKAPMEPQPKFL